MLFFTKIIVYFYGKQKTEMKKRISKIVTVILFFVNGFCFGQVNLVPNPSFEDTTSCPMSGFEINKAIYWDSFRGTSDYFNVCCNQFGGAVGVPANILGFQYPKSGDAYAGMIPYDLTGAPYREYCGVQLTVPTVIGQEYFVTYWISWAGTIGFTLAINKFGVALSTSPYSYLNPYPISNSPNAYSDSIFSDSLNWNQVQLSFVADSVYQYLIVGNFFDDNNTDTIGLGQFNTHSYYYIDDVCLSTDSTYCSNFTGLNQNTATSSNCIMKNVFLKDEKLKITFNADDTEKQLLIYTETGQLLQTVRTNDKEIEIQMTQASSMYLIRAFEKNKSESKKIITIKN